MPKALTLNPSFHAGRFKRDQVGIRPAIRTMFYGREIAPVPVLPLLAPRR